MFILLLRGLLTLGAAAGIAVAGAAAYARAGAEIGPETPRMTRREIATMFFPLCLATSAPAAAGGIYVGLRIAWARPRKRKSRGVAPLILVGIPLVLLSILFVFLWLFIPLCGVVGPLTAIATAKLLGPRAFLLTRDPGRTRI